MAAVAGVAATGHPFGEGAGQDKADGLGDLSREAGGAGLLGGGGRHVSFQTPQDCHVIAAMMVVRQAGGGIVVGRALDQDRYDRPRSLWVPESNSQTCAVSCSEARP